MKNSNNIIIVAVAAASAILVSVSCAKQDYPDISSGGSGTFTAVIDEGLTKTIITDAYKINWVSGDEININGAVYSATPQSDASKADFTKVGGSTPASPYKAIFPASLYDDDTFVFPAIQKYEPGKFNAPMYAEGSSETLEFKNICGVLHFALTGTDKVKSIKIIANEMVCGPFSMTDATTVNFTGSSRTVILTCGSTGVQLDPSTATDFYVYLPPQTYTSGMKVVITNTEGEVCTKTTICNALVARNNVYTFTWDPVFTAPVIPDNALNGLFSVSDTKQVRFSKGNLYCERTSSETSYWTWQFYDEQYQYMPSAPSSFHYGCDRWADTVDTKIEHFTWGYDDDRSVNPISKESARNPSEYVEWGTMIDDSDTWRTLGADEWGYLLNNGGDETLRKGKYRLGVTICGKPNCLVIASDDFDGTIAYSYDAAAWASAEAEGLVCLPAAGVRYEHEVFFVDKNGYYQSSSANRAGISIITSFNNIEMGIWAMDESDRAGKKYGTAVRLVTDSE